MTANSRRKGVVFERAVGKFLGLRRNWMGEHQPDGDLDDGKTVYECKNYSNLATALRMGVDQAVATAGADRWPVAVVKRPGISDVGEAYAVMPLKVWSEIAPILPGRGAK